MKTRTTQSNKVSIETLYSDLEHIKQQVDEELLYGVDPKTGVLTPTARKNIRRLELQERRLENKLLDLEYPRKSPVPVQHDRADYDFVNTLDAYLKEMEEDRVRNELQQIREKGHQDNKELDR